MKRHCAASFDNLVANRLEIDASLYLVWARLRRNAGGLLAEDAAGEGTALEGQYA